MRRISTSSSLGKVLRFVRKAMAGVVRAARQFRISDRALHPHFFAPLGVKFQALARRIVLPQVHILNLKGTKVRAGITKFVRRVVARIPSDPDGSSAIVSSLTILTFLYRFKKRNSRHFCQNCAFCFCSSEGEFLPRQLLLGDIF